MFYFYPRCAKKQLIPMAATVFIVVKEYFAEIHQHSIKARILSQMNDDNTFIFQLSHYYKRTSELEAKVPSSHFTSFSNAERHLLQYLDEMQNTLDLGGAVEAAMAF